MQLTFGAAVGRLVYCVAVAVFGLVLLYLSIFVLWRLENNAWAYSAIPVGFFGALFLTRGVRWASPVCEHLGEQRAEDAEQSESGASKYLLVAVLLAVVGAGFLGAAWFAGDTSTWGGVLVKVFTAIVGLGWIGDSLKLWSSGARDYDRRMRGDQR